MKKLPTSRNASLVQPIIGLLIAEATLRRAESGAGARATVMRRIGLLPTRGTTTMVVQIPFEGDNSGWQDGLAGGRYLTDWHARESGFRQPPPAA